MKRMPYIALALFLTLILLEVAFLAEASYIPLPEPDIVVTEVSGKNYVYINKSFMKYIRDILSGGDKLSSEEATVASSLRSALKELLDERLSNSSVGYAELFLRIEKGCPVLLIAIHEPNEKKMQMVREALEISMRPALKKAMASINKYVEMLIETARSQGNYSSEIISYAMRLNTTAISMMKGFESCSINVMFFENLEPISRAKLIEAFDRLGRALDGKVIKSLDKKDILYGLVGNFNVLVVIVNKTGVDREAIINIVRELRSVIGPEVPLAIEFTEVKMLFDIPPDVNDKLIQTPPESPNRADNTASIYISMSSVSGVAIVSMIILASIFMLLWTMRRKYAS